MAELPSQTRWACPTCDVLQSCRFAPVCWCCGLPMIPNFKYRNPTSSGYLNPMLEMLNVRDT